MQPPLITIVTPTKNARHTISRLIRSLEAQTEKSFVWLVVDSGSDDNTLDLVRCAQLAKIKVLEGKDFSIYHGLNRALGILDTRYYLVAGADDCLEKTSVENYYACVEQGSDPDFVFSATRRRDKIVFPKRHLGWLYGMHGIGSSHSVGTLIKACLHNQVGPYSSRYPMLADAFFVKRAIMMGASSVHSKHIAGTYGEDGLSSSDALHYNLEFFDVQLQTERFALIQLCLFLLRLLKLSLSNREYKHL